MVSPLAIGPFGTSPWPRKIVLMIDSRSIASERACLTLGLSSGGFFELTPSTTRPA